MNINVIKSREKNRLVLDRNSFLIHFDSFYRFTLRAVFPTFAILAADTSSSVPPILFIICLMLCLHDSYRDTKFRPIAISSINGFSYRIKYYLESKGWSVHHDNQDYFYADKKFGWPTHHFYMIYDDKVAYICPVLELPLFFTYFFTESLIKDVREQGHPKIKESPLLQRVPTRLSSALLRIKK